MHRTLLKGLTVVASTAAAMLVFGLGQASATQQVPHHGSPGTVVATADVTRHDAAADATTDGCIRIRLPLVGSIWVCLSGLGQVGEGSAHNQV
ncbi:MAG TPA: hypothetical protein VGL06_02435 [Pseudonocardiaceae bacterium]|jgi:hypothetical protein